MYRYVTQACQKREVLLPLPTGAKIIGARHQSLNIIYISQHCKLLRHGDLSGDKERMRGKYNHHNFLSFLTYHSQSGSDYTNPISQPPLMALMVPIRPEVEGSSVLLRLCSESSPSPHISQSAAWF